MPGINLLPPKLKEERKKAQFNFRVSGICFSLLCIFILGIIGLEATNQILALNLKASQTQIQFEEQEIGKLKDIDQKAKQINEILNLLDNLEKNQILWSKILQDLAACTPSASQIQSLTISSQDSPNFDISGIAASRREIAKFKEKLENSNFWKNIAFISSSSVEREGGTVFDFNLKAEFENKR